MITHAYSDIFCGRFGWKEMFVTRHFSAERPKNQMVCFFSALVKASQP
jgi:hypothetical protein